MNAIKLFILSLVSLTLSCGSLMGPAKLSESEEKALIEYSRKFILSAKALKLTYDEKKLIRHEDPEVRIDYKGGPSDKIIISWPTYMRTVSAHGNGNLSAKDKCSWIIEVTLIEAKELKPTKKKRRR